MKDKRSPGGFPRRTPIHRPRPGALTWPEDLTGRCARVTAIGSRRVLVENHTGILAITHDALALNTGCGPLRIVGEALTLCEARPRCLIVSGRIRSIKLPPEGGDDDP